MADISPIQEINGVIADNECRRCGHFPERCHYWQNDGMPLKGLLIDETTKMCGNFKD